MAILPTKILIGYETVFGETPASPTPFKLNLKNFGLTHTRDSEEDETMGGAIDSGGGKITTGSTNSGDLEATAYWEQAGVFLKAVLGAPVTVDNLDGTYTHTFDTTKTTIPSMYAQVTSGASDLIECFNGIMATMFDTAFSGKGIPSLKLGTVAKSHVDSIKDSYVGMSETGVVALGKTAMNMIFTYAKINDASYCKLSQFNINFDRGTEVEDLLCNNKDISIMKSNVTGSLSSVFDATLYGMIANDNIVKLEVGYSTVISALTHSLGFIMDEVQFSFKTEPKQVGTKVPINADWSAMRSETSTKKATVILTNTVAAY